MIQVISFQKLEFFKSSKGPELPDWFEFSGFGWTWGTLRGVYVFEKNNSYLKLIRNE